MALLEGARRALGQRRRDHRPPRRGALRRQPDPLERRPGGNAPSLRGLRPARRRARRRAADDRRHPQGGGPRRRLLRRGGGRPQAPRRLRDQIGLLALRGHGRGRARRVRRGVLRPHVGALQDARPHPPRRGRGALVHAKQLSRLQPARRARLFAAQAQALQALGQRHPAQPALPPLHGAGNPRQSGEHGPDPALLFPRPRQRGAVRDFRGPEGRVQGIGRRPGRPVGEIRRRAAGGIDGRGFRLALLGGRGRARGGIRPAAPGRRTLRLGRGGAARGAADAGAAARRGPGPDGRGVRVAQAARRAALSWRG